MHLFEHHKWHYSFLGLVVYHIAFASSCNMIYCSGQYSPMLMQWPVNWFFILILYFPNKNYVKTSNYIFVNFLSILLQYDDSLSILLQYGDSLSILLQYDDSLIILLHLCSEYSATVWWLIEYSATVWWLTEYSATVWWLTEYSATVWWLTEYSATAW